MISRSAEYAIRSMILLAGAGDRWLLNREIARELSLPPQFLTKILSTLAREGLLMSQRGKGGGFRLARPAEGITLLDVVDPFDRTLLRGGCLLGRTVCSGSKPCMLHSLWAPVQQILRESLAGTTLAGLTRTPQGKRSLARRRASAAKREGCPLAASDEAQAVLARERSTPDRP
ncbi:MAG: Rrf2 family transcriptional regulator [Candidatus Eisenbacteria bacterium]|nr:Rrf2 family transcriptional regulator [Candidatus Eisenbacteria bacterium]